MPTETEFDVDALKQEFARFQSFLASNEQLKEQREQVRTRLAPTPRDEVYREHSVVLYRYRRPEPSTDQPEPGDRGESGDRAEPATLQGINARPRLATPVLIVPSLVNKPWVMDLLPGESFVQAMIDRGADVFLLEWGEPTPGQRRFSLDTYLQTYLGRAVRRVLRATGAKDLTLAGYCLGGTLALLHAARDDARLVRNLITMVAPVNFDDRGLLSWWSRAEHFDVDRVVDAYGNIPASFFSSSFPWLVPTAHLTKMRTLYDRHGDERFMESFLALDIWITENTPFPGEVYRDFIRDGYQHNVLVKEGSWPMAGGEARLANVQASVLALAAKFDHISPSESCTVVKDMIGSADCTVREYPAAHLGIALGKDVLGNATTRYWDEIADWLRERD